MKKIYVEPVAEKIEFSYQEQVVAASYFQNECVKYGYDGYENCVENETAWAR